MTGERDGRQYPEDARTLYMTSLPVAEAQAQLSKLVEEAGASHERFEITGNGRRAAVLLGADDYDAMLRPPGARSCRARSPKLTRPGAGDRGKSGNYPASGRNPAGLSPGVRAA